ncbi:ABC transporter ATP-binding protein [Bradyrhizobium sp. Arg237L]|uniref:ABC transporter ATP-binding protein n=1 Tax=Bradyrhizobium sp. Arg237L TaxID=3003352 RepID=UPI00249E4E46|nr:ABC transporter ATP-binding protein [Bradyrhizobium sp. Arg237L]MDI4231742.1 ABC transporter ATP-binding protein [Bradyrhizobium sp. Arg237L]
MNAQMLQLVGPVRWRIASSVGIGLLVTICYVLQGIFLAFALAALFVGSPVSDVIWWIVGFAIVVVVRGALVWSAEMAAQATAQSTKEYLRARLLSRLIDLGPGMVLRRQTGDLQTTIVAGVEALETYYSRYLPSIFVAIVGCIGVVLYLAWVDFKSAVLLGAFVIASPLIDRLWLRWHMPKSYGLFAAMGAFGAYLLDSLQGAVTLKAFNAAAARRTNLAQRAADLRREAMTTLSVSLMRAGVTGFITLSGVALMLCFNAWRVAIGDLAPVALFMTLFLAREAFRPLDRLEREFHTAWSASAAAAPIATLLATEPEVREPPKPAAQPAAGDTVFDDVSFAYGEADAPALSSVSFAVREREFVALVGPSGAGKSTVVSLLLRFFDPTSGHIRIGGTDIRELSLDTLRSLISVVSQDTYLFHGTIEDNLKIAKPDATRDEIRTAAKAAHIDDFIDSLPHGYATEVGERGAHLSGGQRQRLAIARALLKDAPILLLDEATSSVDPASERAIQNALDALVGRRTTLVIAHRLSTIRKADRILVLDRGQVVEEGDHRSLEANGRLYSRLMQAQGEAA